MINYGTLIFALFEKLDTIRDTKSIDENISTTSFPEIQRKTRHLKEKMEHNLVIVINIFNILFFKNFLF